jgi:EAL domain-containing protein (putative c-di-GMP-specific phosphodiesterase class I)
VLEITEDSVAEATSDVNEALANLRLKGVRVALDDTGSGLVSWRQLLGVNVDIIKIDTDVTRGVDTDATKQAISYALKSLAERSGAISLAEGVETEQEAEMLTSLGIEAAQGYLFGRPAELR